MVTVEPHAPIYGLVDRDTLFRAIICLVASETGVPAGQIAGPDRQSHVVRARYAIVWLARDLTKMSDRMIARGVGRERSTIVYARAEAAARHRDDQDFRALTDRVKRTLGAA